MKVISRYPQKKDGSGVSKTKDWGFLIGGQAYWGYSSKAKAESILKAHIERSTK